MHERGVWNNQEDDSDNPQSRQMEGSLAFFDRHGQPFSKNIQAAVVGQLEVIHARHDTGQIVVWRVWWFAGSANDCKDGCETLEA